MADILDSPDKIPGGEVPNAPEMEMSAPGGPALPPEATPGDAMGDPGALDGPVGDVPPAEGAPSEEPMEEEPLPDAEGALPTDQSQWEQTTIIEGLGTPDQHEDQFWRLDNFGIELDVDGHYEAYAIVDETPMMLNGSYESFEEAVAAINGEMSHKSLGGDKGESETEPIPSDSPEAEIPDSPKEGDGSEDKGEEKSEEKSEDKGEEKSDDKKEDDKGGDDKKEDKEDSKPAKKSVSGADNTDSIRAMMGARMDSKIHSASNLPRTSRSFRDVAKSQNRTASVGGVTVRIGCDRDAIDMMPGKPKSNGPGVSNKHIDPSVRNAMAPVRHRGSSSTKAPSVDDLYDEKGGIQNARTGVPPAKEVY